MLTVSAGVALLKLTQSEVHGTSEGKGLDKVFKVSK